MNCTLTQLEEAISKIDALNATDPTLIDVDMTIYPAELLYSQRMSQMLAQYDPASQADLKVAVRAQHIARWKYPRSLFPVGKAGYLKWRQELYVIHANLTSEILEKVGCDTEFIQHVSHIMKEKVQGESEGSQTLEDVACLVFIQHYFEDFLSKHEKEKVQRIVKKTWNKMSKTARQFALTLPISGVHEGFIRRSIA